MPLLADLRAALDADPRPDREIAVRAGLHETSVSRFRHSRFDLKADAAERLARALGFGLILLPERPLENPRTLTSSSPPEQTTMVKRNDDDAIRSTRLERRTNETKVALSVNLDGAGRASAHTGVGFFDHMLDLLSRHSLIDLEVTAEGDLHVDQHHTVEDVGLVLGRAIEQALGDKRGIGRYGSATVPMDESLAAVAVDLSGRPAFVFNVAFTGTTIGNFPVELVEEFLKALATSARMNLHVNVAYGSNNHHIAEAIFKATARALRQAVEIDPRRGDGVPSTKGSLG